MAENLAAKMAELTAVSLVGQMVALSAGWMVALMARKLAEHSAAVKVAARVGH